MISGFNQAHVYLLPSTSTCKTVGFNLDRLCGLPDHQRRDFRSVSFGACAKAPNVKKKRKREEQGIIIHPVASAST